MKNSTFMLAAVACATLAVPAIAQSENASLTVTGSQPQDPDTIRVSYADLDLADSTAADTLRARVSKAIQRKCGDLYEGTTPAQRWACFDVAWRVARPQIDATLARTNSGQNLAVRAVVMRFARN
jgi:UrcA family protein